ncbi:MAG: diversity-generating retroelement protein Avd [Nitrospira sp.]|nr:diversity-generating retroelement protein Avd [Nitrospira sp.]
MSQNIPQAVQLCHEVLAWVIPQLDKFPRSRRFTLGERVESGLLEVLEWLVEAGYSRAKLPALDRANLRLARVNHIWRLAYELKVVGVRQYEHGAKLMDDLGRQIGGWRRSCSPGEGRHETA